MKMTKRRYEMFSIFDRAGLERRLAKLAEKGWLLDEIGQVFWIYRRIEPKKLTFCICCFPEAGQYDPEPTPEQQAFYELCAHAGWKLAATSGQLQVFYNERPDPVPLETDPVMTVAATHHMAKNYFLPGRFFVIAAALLYGWLQSDLWKTDPIRLLSNGSLLWGSVSVLGVFLMCVLDVGHYFLWYVRAKKAAEWGELLRDPGYFRMDWIFYLWIAVSLAANLLSVPRLTAAIIGVRALMAVGIISLIATVRKWFKHEGEPAENSRVAILGLSFIFSFAMVSGATWLEQKGTDSNWFGDGCATYEYSGRTYINHQDELPVTVEDLVDVRYDGYTRERQTVQSFLLSQSTMTQRPRYDAADYNQMPTLEYTVVEAKLPSLYGLCRDSLLRRWSYSPTDPAPWGAVEAYRWSRQTGSPGNQFLLCYEDRIVTIFFDFEEEGPAPAQMTLVGERLGG